MMATGASLVTSCNVPSLAARLLKTVLSLLVRVEARTCRPAEAPGNTQLLWGGPLSGGAGESCEFAPGHIKRSWENNLYGSAGYRDEVLGHDDIVPTQRHDVGDLLAEDQDEDRSCPVTSTHVGLVAQSVNDFCLSVGVESRTCAATVGLDLDRGVTNTGLGGPVEEPRGEAASGTPVAYASAPQRYTGDAALLEHLCEANCLPHRVEGNMIIRDPSLKRVDALERVSYLA